MLNTSSQSSVPLSAPLWRRLAALVYDIFPLFGISCGVVAIVMGLAYVIGLNEFDAAFKNTLPNWIMTPLLVASWALFYIGFWMYKQQTLGMLAWRIQLQNCSTAPFTKSQLITRAVVGVISLASCGLGYLWMLYDPQNRTWHDIASNTKVVLNPK